MFGVRVRFRIEGRNNNLGKVLEMRNAVVD